jgi:predicted phosphodiesterase
MRKSRVRYLFIVLALVCALALPGCSWGGKSSSGSTPEARSSRPASNQKFKFIVCGDPQNNYEVFGKVLDAARSVDFLIVAGDETGSGTPTEFQNFVNVMKNSGIKYYCVPGNHDVATSPVDQAYKTYLGPPFQSFDYMNSHFVLIDNSSQNLGFYPAERQWVRDDLKAARKKGYEHTFAVCHVPPGYPYSGDIDAAHVRSINTNRQLAPILSAGGVEELFCGHFHSYLQEKEDGLLITITGGAGAPLMGTVPYHYVLVEINGKKRTQKRVDI